jgi:hypothetical protein
MAVKTAEVDEQKTKRKHEKVISQWYKVNTEQNINNILLINMTQSKNRIVRSALALSSVLIHVLAHFQRTTCSQIYFSCSSYLSRKPLLRRSTAFICQLYKVNTEQNINNILLINMTQSCQIKHFTCILHLLNNTWTVGNLSIEFFGALLCLVACLFMFLLIFNK